MLGSARRRLLAKHSAFLGRLNGSLQLRGASSHGGNPLFSKQNERHPLVR